MMKNINLIQQLFTRDCGLANQVDYDFALRRLCVNKGDSWRGITPSSYGSDFNPEPPIFSAKFANCNGNRHWLAIANEDGMIAIQDTTIRNTEPVEKSLTAPQCHYNAVFDLEWVPGEMSFVSASGDHTARLWCITNTDIRNVTSFLGHTRSVKTVAFSKIDASVFATGGRDGAIIVWDTRTSMDVATTYRTDNCIYSGHISGAGTPVSQRRRARTPKLSSNTPSSTVTGLVFQDENTLISCGASDGIIKIWDLRRNYTTYKKEPLPKYSIPYAGTSTFKGYTNLIIDESGSKLFANCMDNTIYCFNISSYSAKPLAYYRGLEVGTFYIKSCLSPDGKYLASGSSDGRAYIWNLEHPNQPLLRLCGHNVEVTCVAWGSSHDFPIVTCSDDARHKIWRLGPSDLTPAKLLKYYRGHAELIRTSPIKKIKPVATASELELTPKSGKYLQPQQSRDHSTSAKRSLFQLHEEPTATDECLENIQLTKRSRLQETCGRRLFASNVLQNVDLPNSTRNLSSIPEEDMGYLCRPQKIKCDFTHDELCQKENVCQTPSSPTQLPSNILTHRPTGLSEQSNTILPSNKHVSPSSTTTKASETNLTEASFNAVISSPTSNLPNYVLDGDAPHLGIMSPKRKINVKVDWLTKMRKQKLMMSKRTGVAFSERLEEQNDMELSNATTNTTIISSPRIQNLRIDESSPRSLAGSPRKRRSSHSGHHSDGNMSPNSILNTARTPTSSRRNSETTLLRFFTIQK